MTTSTVTAPTITGLLATPCMPLRFLMGPGGSRGGRAGGEPAGLRLGAELFALRRVGAAGRGRASAAGDGGGGAPGRASVPPASAASCSSCSRCSSELSRRRMRRRCRRGARPGELRRAAAGFALTYSRQLVRVTRRRVKWPYLVESVGGGGAVVDQVDEAVEAPGFLGAGEEFGQVRGRAGAAAGQVAASCVTTGSAARSVGPATSPVAPSDFSETVEAAEKGVSSAGRFGERGRRLAEVGEDRRGGVGEALQAAHRACGTRAGRRGTCAARLPAPAPRSELAWAAAPALVKKPATLGAFARERPEDLLGVGGELGQLVALGVEDADQAVDVAQRRVGPLDRRLDVGAAAGEAGAEFVEDQAEALRVGQFVDVVDQVRVDAGAVVLQRQQVLAGAGLAGRDLLQRRRRLASRARAAGSGGSRRTSRRSATAAGSGSWRRCGSPGSRGRSIFITITALPAIACSACRLRSCRPRPAG